MVKFIFQKTIYSFLTWLLLITFIYIIINLFNHNPYKVSNFSDTSEYNQAVENYGINNNVVKRYFVWLSTFVRKGEAGQLYSSAYLINVESVNELFFGRINNSLQIVIPALFIGMIIGIFVGYFISHIRNRYINKSITLILSITLALPSLILILIFILFDPTIMERVNNHTNLSNNIPVFVVMTLLSFSAWTLFMRKTSNKILKSKYVDAARCNGVSGTKLFTNYILKNFIDAIFSHFLSTYLLVLGAYLMVGSFISNEKTIIGLIAFIIKYSEYELMASFISYFVIFGLGIKLLSDLVRFIVNPNKRTSNELSKLQSFIEKWLAIRFLKNYLKGGVNAKPKEI